MKNLLILSIISLFFFVSCGNKPDQEKVASMLDSLKEIPSVAPSDTDQFGYKTGVVVYTSTTMGITQQITMWFDDFGRKTMSEIESTVLGQRIQKRNIVKDSMVYNIDMISRTGSWMNVSEDSSSENYNYRTLTDESMKMHNIVFEGTESLLGKDCKIYSQKLNVDEQEVFMKVWAWEGIPLKTISSISGIEITMEALQMRVNIEIPAEKFDVPKGVKMEEVRDTTSNHS